MYSHIRVESVWDDVPTVNSLNPADDIASESSASANFIDKNLPENTAEDTYESLVGRVELMNLKKIELGIVVCNFGKFDGKKSLKF